MTTGAANLIWTDPLVRTDRFEFGRDHSKDSDLARLVDLAKPNKKEKALDLVTGLGYTAIAIAPHVAEVDAIDPDGELLEQAKKFAKEAGIRNINFIEGDPYAIPAKERHYNLVIARMAFRHINEPAKCLREIRRVLKPTGRLILIDILKPFQPDLASFLGDVQKQRDRSHVQSLNLEEWENLLDREEFDINLIEIFPREYDFETWAGKETRSSEEVRMLGLLLHGASPRAKRYFRITEKEGKPRSFAVWVIVIRAGLQASEET